MPGRAGHIPRTCVCGASHLCCEGCVPCKGYRGSAVLAVYGVGGKCRAGRVLMCTVRCVCRTFKVLFSVYACVLAKAAVDRVCRRRSGFVVPFGVPPASVIPPLLVDKMNCLCDKTKWSFSCSTDKVTMGNRKCGLRGIQILFTCVYEIVDRCIHCGRQCKYFMGVGSCSFV